LVIETFAKLEYDVSISDWQDSEGNRMTFKVVVEGMEPEKAVLCYKRLQAVRGNDHSFPGHQFKPRLDFKINDCEAFADKAAEEFKTLSEELGEEEAIEA
jgi:hypothetical protein